MTRKKKKTFKGSGIDKMLEKSGVSFTTEYPPATNYREVHITPKLRDRLKVVNEIKKNEEEYKKLLERKNQGEDVDDLIEKNRNYAKILAEQNMKVWE